MRLLTLGLLFTGSIANVTSAQEISDITENVNKNLKNVNKNLKNVNKDDLSTITKNMKFFVADSLIQYRFKSQAFKNQAQEKNVEPRAVGDFFSLVHKLDPGSGNRPPLTEILVGGQLIDSNVDANEKKILSIKLLSTIYSSKEKMNWLSVNSSAETKGHEYWEPGSIWYTGLTELVAFEIARNSKPKLDEPKLPVIFNRRYANAAALMAMVIKFANGNKSALSIMPLSGEKREEVLVNSLEKFCPQMKSDWQAFGSSADNAGKIMIRCLVINTYESLTRSAENNKKFFNAIKDFTLTHELFSYVWMELMLMKGVEEGGLFKNEDLIQCGENGKTAFGDMNELHSKTRRSIWNKFNGSSVIEGTTALYVASLLFMTSPKRAELRRSALCDPNSRNNNFVSEIFNNDKDEQFKSYKKKLTISTSGNESQFIDIKYNEKYFGRLVIAGIRAGQERSGLTEIADNHIGKQKGPGAGSSDLSHLEDLFTKCESIERDVKFIAQINAVWVDENAKIKNYNSADEKWTMVSDIMNINPTKLDTQGAGNNGYPESARTGEETKYRQVKLTLGERIKKLNEKCGQKEKLNDIPNAFSDIVYKKAENNGSNLTVSHAMTMNVRMPSGAAERIGLYKINQNINNVQPVDWSNYKLIGFDADFSITGINKSKREIKKILEGNEDIVIYLLARSHILGEAPLVFMNDINVGFYFLGTEGSDGGGAGAPDILDHFPSTRGDVLAIGTDLEENDLKSFQERGKKIERLAEKSKDIGNETLNGPQMGIIQNIWQISQAEKGEAKLVQGQWKRYKIMRDRSLFQRNGEKPKYYYFANELMPEASALAYAFYLADNLEGTKAVMEDMVSLREMGTDDARADLSFIFNPKKVWYDPYYWSLLFLKTYCGLGDNKFLQQKIKSRFGKKGGENVTYPAPDFGNVDKLMRGIFGENASGLALVRIATHSTFLEKRVAR